MTIWSLKDEEDGKGDQAYEEQDNGGKFGNGGKRLRARVLGIG